jgi:hypothetical protein
LISNTSSIHKIAALCHFRCISFLSVIPTKNDRVKEANSQPVYDIYTSAFQEKKVNAIAMNAIAMKVFRERGMGCTSGWMDGQTIMDPVNN